MQTAIMFSSDAVNADTSPDKSELTIHLDPALPIAAGRDAAVILESFRFVNHIKNVSAALGNNRFVARWRAKNGDVFSATFTLADASYELSTLRTAINAALRTHADWPETDDTGATTAGVTDPIKSLAADALTNRVSLELDPMWGDQPTANSAWQLEIWDAFNAHFGAQFDRKARDLMILNRVDTTYTLKEYVFDVANQNPVTTAATIVLPKGYMTVAQFILTWNSLVDAVSATGQNGAAWSDSTKAGFRIGGATLDTNVFVLNQLGGIRWTFGAGDSQLFNEYAQGQNKVVRTVTSAVGGSPVGLTFSALYFANEPVIQGDSGTLPFGTTVNYATKTTVPIVVTTTDEPHLLSMLGFELTQQPISSVLSATAVASHSSHQLGLTYTAQSPAHLDRSNCIRVDVDAVTGNYAPPSRHLNGRSTGNSDSLAFIPIIAASGHQQVYQPPNPLRGRIPGSTHVSSLKITLRDQCGEKVPMDEHYSGCLIVTR